MSGAFPTCLLTKAGMTYVLMHNNPNFDSWSLPDAPSSSLKYVHVGNTNLQGTVLATAYCDLQGAHPPSPRSGLDLCSV